MDTNEKTYYEDDYFLVTASRLLFKRDTRTLLIADLREPRLELGPSEAVDPRGLWERVQRWTTGGELYLTWEALSVRHQGRAEELDRTVWFFGSPAFETAYASGWDGSAPVRDARDRLRALAEALGAAVADHAARHPGAPAVPARVDEGEQKGALAGPAAPPPAPAHGGAGFGWLALVALVIGGAFLYQREGGKVFEEKKREPIVPAVTSVEATFDTGLRSHDVVLTHRHNEGVLPNHGGLLDVDLTVTLHRQDGTTHQVRKFWADWPKGEAKKVNVPAHKYQKVELTGTCRAAVPAPKAAAGGGLQPGVEVQPHVFRNSWTWDWDRR